MSNKKPVSRRKLVATSGALLLPACLAEAQAPGGQAPQGQRPKPQPGPPGMPKPAPSVPVDRAPLFQPEGPNKPIGVGKGIFPGRVVWVHNPEVATWDGKTGEWWDDAYTNEAVVERMMSKALQGLSGKKTDKEAWDALFRHFNKTQHKTDAGYKRGEKITIKINCNRDVYPDEGWTHRAVTRKGMASPHVVNALIRQLVNVAGVPGEDMVVRVPHGVRGLPAFPASLVQVYETARVNLGGIPQKGLIAWQGSPQFR